MGDQEIRYRKLTDESRVLWEKVKLRPHCTNNIRSTQRFKPWTDA